MVMCLPPLRRFFTLPMFSAPWSLPEMIFGFLLALTFICWWMGTAAFSRMRFAVGAPAHPYIRPAYDVRQDEAYEIIREGLRNALDKL